VVVEAVNNGDGRLRVRFTVSNANNAIRRIQIPRNDNGVVIPSPPPLGMPSTEFFIARQTPNVPTTVSFTITDACGDWQTFVGGGATAF
jgi:hypothetical protein